MGIKTKAYYPMGLSYQNMYEGNLPVIVSDEIFLIKDEIISMPLNDNAKGIISGITERTKYKIRFLDKYDKSVVFNKPEQYAKITYEVTPNKTESVFIKINEYQKKDLKWDNKMALIQNKDNINIAIAILTLLVLIISMILQAIE